MLRRPKKLIMTENKKEMKKIHQIRRMNQIKIMKVIIH